MDKNELSERYFDAFDRMYYNLSEVVEMLHDEEGDPISDPEIVGNIVTTLKQYIALEMDLIKELSKEYTDGI
tara:strand:+ start:856 stop:1071 length:216 start_codon:yes stop_codon:yes gene_type:complete